MAEGYAVWLDELPGLVQSLADDWSLSIGATLHGGHAAFVAEATTFDGTRAVLKVGVPGNLPEPPLPSALPPLPTLSSLSLSAKRHDLLCDLATRLWRPVGTRSTCRPGPIGPHVRRAPHPVVAPDRKTLHGGDHR